MFKHLFASSLIFYSFSAFSDLSTDLTIEEHRIEKATSAMPNVLRAFSDEVTQFEQQWKNLKSFTHAKKLVHNYSNQLWLDAKQHVAVTKNYDDRALYWARLLSSKVIRTTTPAFVFTSDEQNTLLIMLENGSRGRTDLTYSKGTTKKILLTGFDPFLLGISINQSNPSGVAALLLDNQVISYKGITAEINTVMVPVRYKDFDQGIIEALLAPYYTLNNIDMIVTLSMGREEFDLERFPGKRRSVTAPDNANIIFGGTQTDPVIPRLNKRPLPGNEFVEFSLPVTQMQQVKGPYKVIDNHTVTTLDKTYKPKTLAELNGKVAVSGSGGGYLSNEISYRSIRLRDQLNSTIPTGHIHTPRIEQFEPKIEAKIVAQIQAMLEKSLVAL
jgi:pyrrolidone-carboxylate peptidase